MGSGGEPVIAGAPHHIDLNVRSLDVSKQFYQTVLGALGYELAVDRAEIAEFNLPAPVGHFHCSIGLVPAERHTPHDRYAPGLHHLAFRALSRADVDAFYAVLVQMGATILDAPADYPQYSAGYYAVFFTDPDGLKLELVHKP